MPRAESNVSRAHRSMLDQATHESFGFEGIICPSLAMLPRATDADIATRFRTISEERASGMDGVRVRSHTGVSPGQRGSASRRTTHG